jgi:tape measure domain-containing protein
MDMLAHFGLGLDIRDAQAGLAQYTGSAHHAGRATEHFERTTKNLTAALGAFGGYLGVRQLVEYADTWTLINARVKMVTNSHAQATVVMRELSEIAVRSRNTLAATAVLYTRTAMRAERLGRSHRELLDFTEAVNLSMLKTGATGVEAAQAMRQLAQGIGAVTVQGRHLRTIMHAMPELAQAIADEIGIAVGDMEKAAAKGMVTSDIVIRAALANLERWREETGEMPFTMGQAFGILVTHLTTVVGVTNTAFGITEKLATAIIWLAKNATRLIGIMGGLIATMIAYRTAMVIAAVVTKAFAAYETIRNIILLAQALRTTGESMLLIKAAGRGIIGVAAMLIAAGAGVYAYRKIVQEITEAMDELAAASADLDDPIGALEHSQENARRRLQFIRDFRQELADALRVSQQGIELARLQGMAQDELAEEFERVNTLIRVRIELDKAVFDGTIDRLTATKLMAEAEEVYGQVMRNNNEARREAILLEQRYANFDIRESAEQRIRLAQRIGLSQRLLAAEYDAANRRLEAQKTLTGEPLRMRLANIDLEAELAQYVVVYEYVGQEVTRIFAETFSNIFREGINSFRDLVEGIKQMFIRLAAELAAMELMEFVSEPIIDHLSALLGATKEQLDAALAMELEPVQVDVQPIAGAFQLRMEYEPLPVEIKRDLRETITEALTAGFAGFAVGSMVGSMTSDKIAGSLSGAMSGAMAGAIVGGPMGAAIGGLTGALGGLISSSANNSAELRRHQERLRANNEKLRELRESILGLDRAWIAETAIALRAVRGSGLFRHSEDHLRNLAILADAAKRLGIEFNGTRDMVRQLEEALELTIIAMTQFGRNLSDLQRRHEAYNKLFDVEVTPAVQLQDIYTILSEMAPELMRELGIANLDLTTEIGRRVLEEALREIYRMILEGDFTADPALLGAFADKNQLLDAILKVKDALNEFHEQLYKVTTDFPRAMDIVYYEQKFGRYAEEQPSEEEKTRLYRPPFEDADRFRKGTDKVTDGFFTLADQLALVNTRFAVLANQIPEDTYDPKPPAEKIIQQNNTSTESVVIQHNYGGVTIQNYGHETGEQLLDKIENARYRRHTRGSGEPKQEGF